MNKYEVNNETMAVIGIEPNKTKIMEYQTDSILEENAYEVMDYSCCYFGSSYQGRVEGSKRMLGFNYKLPIIVEETRGIIFFPTTSPSSYDCIWLSLNSIDKVLGDSVGTRILFKNGKDLVIPISKLSIENQIVRASRLQCLLDSRKVEKS